MRTKNLFVLDVTKYKSITLRWYNHSAYWGIRPLGHARIAIDIWRFGVIIEDYAPEAVEGEFIDNIVITCGVIATVILLTLLFTGNLV